MEDLFALLINPGGFEYTWRNGELYVRRADAALAPLATELAAIGLRTTPTEPRQASSRTRRLTSETPPSACRQP